MSTPSPRKQKRPAAITIAGWILFLGALVNLAVGALFVYAADLSISDPETIIILEDEDSTAVFTEQGEFAVQGAVSLILGAIEFVFVFGFWRLLRWAWIGAMSWQALKLLLELAAVFLGGGSVISILFAAIVVFLLNQADVRRAFQIPRANESFPPTLRPFDIN
jgi:hypothetical protein